VHIHDYANVEVYVPDEVVRRAESKVGQQKFNMFTNRSSHLAQECKIKHNNYALYQNNEQWYIQ